MLLMCVTFLVCFYISVCSMSPAGAHFCRHTCSSPQQLVRRSLVYLFNFGPTEFELLPLWALKELEALWFSCSCVSCSCVCVWVHTWSPIELLCRCAALISMDFHSVCHDFDLLSFLLMLLWQVFPSYSFRSSIHGSIPRFVTFCFGTWAVK